MNRIIKSNRKDYGIAPIIMIAATLLLLVIGFIPIFIPQLDNPIIKVIEGIIAIISFIAIIIMSFRCPRWLVFLVWGIIIASILFLLQPSHYH